MIFRHRSPWVKQAIASNYQQFFPARTRFIVSNLYPERAHYEFGLTDKKSSWWKHLFLAASHVSRTKKKFIRCRMTCIPSSLSFPRVSRHQYHHPVCYRRAQPRPRVQRSPTTRTCGRSRCGWNLVPGSKMGNREDTELHTFCQTPAEMRSFLEWNEEIVVLNAKTFIVEFIDLSHGTINRPMLL